MDSLKTIVDNRISEEKKNQDLLYESLVVPNLHNVNRLVDKYKEYQKRLEGFDVRAFEKTLHTLTTKTKINDPDRYSSFAEQFDSIPEYANARNNWDDKVKDILESDADTLSKQSAIDSLDFSRTKAHTRMIKLFNNLNSFAKEHGIADPYPNNSIKFNPNNPKDRECAAQIMEKHYPILDSVNNFMSHELSENKFVSQKTMTIGQLYKMAKAAQPNKITTNNPTKSLDLELT